MKQIISKLFARVAAIAAVAFLTAATAWGESVTWPGTTALPSTFTTIGSSPIQIKVSTTNDYANPIRIYSGTTVTIKVASGYVINSVTYMASSTGNYVTYAQNATVSPQVTPTVSGKNVTWSYARDNVFEEFKFTPSAQTRSDGITVVYSAVGSTDAATTTTISTLGITNTDVYISTVAGALSATVKDNNNNVISSASVVWSGNNDEVATIDASSGSVTLVSAGTVTFTATYAGVSGQYAGSAATYQMTVTDSTPYVQPTEIEIIPNFTFWGKDSQFSGDANDYLSGSKDNVTLEWTRGNGSTYANTSAMRFYKDNELVFTAPNGYEIKSIAIVGNPLPSDLTFSPQGFNGENHIWSGSSSSVTMSRPSDAQSYATITKYTITIGLTSTDPEIIANDLSIEYSATSGSIAFTITNPVSGGVVTASTAAEWLTLGTVGETVPFTCTANTENSGRTATVTLTYTYNTNEIVTRDVTITQAALVVDYATLPFAFDGVKAAIETTNGLTMLGLGKDYDSSPHLRFDETDDWVILRINQAPGELTYHIKGNSFSGGTFKVQASVDGVTYNDLKTYTTLGDIQEVFDNLDENVRYIKWVYTQKSSGNVALGNITLDKKPAAAPDTYDLNLTAGDGGYWGTFYNGVARYELPEGAQAFTMNASKQLYRLGSNGRSISANTAVVIIADVETITLTKAESEEAVTVNGGENILQGGDFSVANTGNQYVLGKKEGVIGFFKFTGASIPANKAYYVYVVSE